jgi:hypothetical protein
MAKLTTPAEEAKALTARERLLLFCAASGTDWSHVIGNAGTTLAAMMVNGLITRDWAGEITPTDRGRAVLRAMLGE